MSDYDIIRRLEIERDNTIIQKIENGETLEHSQRDEVLRRFKAYPELMAEISELRQENREALSKLHRAMAFLDGSGCFSVDADEKIDREFSSNDRRKQALEALGLIDDKSDLSKVRLAFVLHRYLELIETESKTNAVRTLAADMSCSPRAVTEKLKASVKNETDTSGEKPDFLVGVLPPNWPDGNKNR